MHTLTAEGLRVVTEIAQRNGVSVDAATGLLNALSLGNGAQAQFNHPDLGGVGQWSAGGMIMIGDMFNQELKYRVDRLCRELAGVLPQRPWAPHQSQNQSSGADVSLFVAGSGASGAWWPAELGNPASTGSQNDLRYAYFPATRRLAIQQNGRVSVYDTGEHSVSGFSQAQSGDQTLTFNSQLGLVRVADLPLVSPHRDEPPARAAPAPDTQAAPAPTPPPPREPGSGLQMSGDALFSAIERLADLRQKNILSEDEFAAKKRELLSRL